MKKEKIKYLLPLAVLAIIGVVVFWKTFQLEIFGDEWEGIWWTTSTLQQTGHFNDRVGYKPYETAAILLNLVSGATSLNYNSTAVYIFSFLTRLLAAYCLYYFLIRRKLSITASFVGTLAFLITPIGLQVTDWAKNFTSYISIAFFLLCLDSVLDLKTFRRIPMFLSAFAISVYVNPIRAHGIILMVFFLLILQLIFNKSVNKKSILLLLFGSMGIILLFSKMMLFGNSGQFQSGLIRQFVLILNEALSGNLTRIRDLSVLIGNGVLPKPSVVYALSLVALLLVWKKYLFTERYLPATLLFNIVFLFVLLRFRMETTIIVGIYFTLFSIAIFLNELFNKRILESIIAILPLLLNISFIVVPWILGNIDTSESTNRYLIFPALGIPIIIAFSLSQNRFNQFKDFFSVRLISITLFVALLLLLMFSLTTKSEVNGMYLRHNQYTAKIIWQQITPYFDNFDFKNRVPIILFDSDNGSMLHDTVLFGLGYHMGYIYKIWDYDKLPIPLDGPETLKSMLTDGKASKRYTGKEIVFPKEDAFYFKINGNIVRRVDIEQLFSK